MALKSAAPFPLFPPNLSFPRRRSSTTPTEIRFSRWNNANAEPFQRRLRQQKEIDDDIRRHRRFDSATKIADVSDDEVQPSFSRPSPPDYKSPGTPSSPSSPSIRGKASKYSKSENSNKPSHPAFRRSPLKARVPPVEHEGETGITVSEKGITYKLKDAPFEFQYSYTETPKLKPLALREPQFLPFGPMSMPRPWTGRAPLPASKKKLPEFDSFRLPPPGKKGVKPVQAPGPYLAGSGPKYAAATREEILGEPLTNEEIKELIKGSLKSKRQLNMGRDGLTHNMLDNIHAHWKRQRVCKIKCKGVCTVDMDNVHQQLEEKTGGRVIYGRGGVLYLYRGRNYNYRTRPRYPLMLWKPMAPVYPRLVQHAPEGLTLEEATEMRRKGRQIPPICKLGKNGLYSNLVRNVKEAFEVCELVRINCKDLNKSDYRKIGAKLRDLVSCVLVSFEYEHILLWRGKEWKSTSLPSDHKALSIDKEIQKILEGEETNDKDMSLVNDFGRDVVDIPGMDIVEVQGAGLIENLESSTPINKELPTSDSGGRLDYGEDRNLLFSQSDTDASSVIYSDSMEISELEMLGTEGGNGMVNTNVPWLEGVMRLVVRAVEAGSAVVLDEETLDADIVLGKSVAHASKAPPVLNFQHRSKTNVFTKINEEKSDNNGDEDVETLVVFPRKGNEKKKSWSRKNEAFPEVIPNGSLGVDELAKLLA
ncbi:hypothetical protein KSP39_PZI019063 [Platanthera zijinensis]|uniref:CRM domain-containing protein n=1 Tax=Platanthera zijinensis TaxID=2320716 RepID=A0AAP0B1V6_9ASPA